MRERYFCTVYDAVRAILPAGLWFREDGTRRVRDKTVEMACLSLPREEAEALAEAKRRRSPLQAEILELLCSFDALPSRDLLHFTGASRPSLTALCKQGAVELSRREVYRRPLIEADSLPLPTLNTQQQRVFEGLNCLAQSGNAAAALLFGVTGSGKTSVYIHLIEEQLRRGRGAILLVPEIALTPQMIQTFSSHFGDSVAVLHSSLSPGERYDEWKRIRSRRARLAIGTRSAVFAPMTDPGIIIIDEEQEETYKSENTPRYHARDIAKYRCKQSDCLLLLGSATPEIVSRYRAEEGVYSYFELPQRYNDRELPTVRIVDMKRELRRGNTGNISSVLRDEIRDNLERGEQSILFLNRRGAHKLVSCGECGFTYRCPRCSVSLTYHSTNGRLMCHYCSYSKKLDSVCPDCGGLFSFIGAGTQLVEEELHSLFEGIETLRLDTDTVTPAGSHEQLFERFREEKIPVMVGTQMVTKGLNFENVTLVGVISADQGLYAGDYRAGERSFSLITQVVGRSGRGSKAGRAVIQTFTPENETIRLAANQDYDAFFRSELEMRRIQGAPPFRDLLCITASGLDESLVVRACRFVRERLEQLLSPASEATLLGPAPLAVVRVNNRYRYRINISCVNSAAVRAAISQTVIECCTDKRFRGVSVFADVDPVD
ncbi:MAG: primosomal protein N', partial [Oscillospiraceae bacterium]|nr:primosomal protein N' [Oscillospiraceae bacterium]